MDEEKLIITIERGPELYEAWAENIAGIYGMGESVSLVKDDILKAIELYKEINDDKYIPELLKSNFDIEWHFLQE